MHREIEEIMKDLDAIFSTNFQGDYESGIKDMAERLYNAGYRKSTDVVREIFAEIEKALYHLETPVGKYLVINSGRLAELRKKYESEETE